MYCAVISNLRNELELGLPVLHNHTLQQYLLWIFLVFRLEMATAQRTRPRAVVGAPRRAAWQLKSALRHSISAAPRTKIFLHFFYNYCW